MAVTEDILQEEDLAMAAEISSEDEDVEEDAHEEESEEEQELQAEGDCSVDMEDKEISIMLSQARTYGKDSDADGKGVDHHLKLLRRSPVIPLSKDASRLLRRVSKSLDKRPARAARPCARIISDSIRRSSSSSSSSSLMASLYSQLQSLKDILPQSHQSKDSCIVTDALDYLKALEQEIKYLNQGLTVKEKQSPSSSSSSQPSKVVVTRAGPRLEIHVSCDKRPGLLPDLMVLLEGAGLVLDHVNASCHNLLIFEASSTTTPLDEIDPSNLKNAILSRICKLEVA